MSADEQIIALYLILKTQAGEAAKTVLLSIGTQFADGASALMGRTPSKGGGQ